jgi:hypothetical protein
MRMKKRNFQPPLSRRVHTALTIPDGLRRTGKFRGPAQGLIKVDGTFV